MSTQTFDDIQHQEILEAYAKRLHVDELHSFAYEIAYEEPYEEPYEELNSYLQSEIAYEEWVYPWIETLLEN